MTWRPLLENDQPGRGLAVSLKSIASRLGSAAPDDVASVFSLWPEVVGEQVGSHARPQAIVDGSLQVEVDDQRWATQLKWLAPDIVRKLNAEIGRDVLKAIELRLVRR